MNASGLATVFSGIAFAILWSSASTAGKFGLQSADPLWFFTLRFLLAGALLLSYVHLIRQNRLPKQREWLHLTVFGAFNTALYLGIFIIALQYVAAGITTLSIALNPLLIGLLTAFWLKRPIPGRTWLSLFLGLAGVGIATYPLVATSYASPLGLALLAISMITYSIGSVYYSAVDWQLPRLAINGWQVTFGGLMLLPFAVVWPLRDTVYDLRFWGSLLWLIVPVSMVAVHLWLWLLKSDAVKAAIWLYLCPVFGILFSWWLLDEPFTIFTAIGGGFVILALYLGHSRPYPAPQGK
jgi:probable blue pigment (indigoidine) exporter